MRKEIENWWKQAEADFENSKKNLKIKAYYVSVFLCQQAVEKYLKTLYMLKLRESPGTTHSLIFLATKINVPRKFFSFFKKLTPEFLSTRYPDIVDEAPCELYDEKITKEFIKQAEEFIKWVENQIKKH